MFPDILVFLIQTSSQLTQPPEIIDSTEQIVTSPTSSQPITTSQLLLDQINTEIISTESIENTTTTLPTSLTQSSTPLSIPQTTLAIQQLPTSMTSPPPELCSLPNIGKELNGRKFIPIAGDFTITIYTSSTTDVLEFIVTRINELKLIGLNVTLGLRGFQVTSFDEVTEFLVQEIQFQKKCLVDSLGIFVTREIWDVVREVVHSFDANVWVLEGRDEFLFPHLVHMLFELPWRDKGKIELDIRSPSPILRTEFEKAAKTGDLCIANASTDSHKIVIAINDEAFKVKQPITNNETIFAVPLSIRNDIIECKYTVELVYFHILFVLFYQI